MFGAPSVTAQKTVVTEKPQVARTREDGSETTMPAQQLSVETDTFSIALARK